MKKLILIIAVMLSSCITYAADTTQVKVVDSTHLNMNKVYNDIKSGIAGMASALKVGAEHVYRVVVRQQIISGVTTITLYIIIAVFALMLMRKGDKMRNDDEDESDLPHFLILIGILIAVADLIFVFFTVSDTITGIFNPEYGAIKDIINFVK